MTDDRHFRIGVIGGGIGLFLLGAWLLGYDSLAWMLRLLAGGMVALSMAEMCVRRRYELLLSPLYLLGTVATVFYSLVPAGFVSIFGDVRTRFNFPEMGPAVGYTLEFVGSPGEVLILAFAVECLTLALITTPRQFHDPESEFQTHRYIDRPRIFWVLFLLAGSLVCLFAVKPDTLREPFVWGFNQLYFVLLQIIALIAVFSAISMTGGRKNWVKFISLATLLTAMIVLTHSAKFVILLIGVMAIVFIAFSRPSLRRLTGTAFVTLGVVLAALLFMNALRGYSHYPLSMSQSTIYQVAQKLVLRQGWTGYCLNNVVTQRDNVGVDHPAYYFLSALVPSIIWSDKPTLADGSEYGITYCGNIRETMNTHHKHSASVTLLGEPLDRSGWTSLFFASGIVLVGLGWLGRYCLTGGMTRFMFLTSLLPWTIDFDQQFSMYLAHIIKAGVGSFLILYMMSKFERMWASRSGIPSKSSAPPD